MMSPSKLEFQKSMTENLNGAEAMSSKIISYKAKAPQAPEGELAARGTNYQSWVWYQYFIKMQCQILKLKEPCHLKSVILIHLSDIQLTVKSATRTYPHEGILLFI